MLALSGVQSEAGPLQAYVMLTELDGRRAPEHRLNPETVALLAGRFTDFSNQYLIFSEFPALDDASITSFIHVAENLNSIPNRTLRGNAMGMFEATVGLWQILARQG